MRKSDILGNWENPNFDLNLNENSFNIIWKGNHNSKTSGYWFTEKEILELSESEGNFKRKYSVEKFNKNSLILKDLTFENKQTYHFTQKTSLEIWKIGFYKKLPVLKIKMFFILFIGIIIGSLISFGLINGLLFLLSFGIQALLYAMIVFGGAKLINRLLYKDISENFLGAFYFTTVIIAAYYIILTKNLFYIF